MLAKKIFGHDHEIKFDSIINHDTYTYLRVTMEVPRGQDTEALVLLNGREIGKVSVVREGKKATYQAYRKSPTMNIYIDFTNGHIFKEMGRATAAIISDYIDIK